MHFDPVETNFPLHEDLEEMLPLRSSPHGRGPEGVVIRQDVLRHLGVLQGGAPGDAGLAQLELV